MSATSTPVVSPERVHSRSRLDRVLAIAEVVLAFVVVHVTYRFLKHFTVVGQWDAGTNFTPGAVMIAFTVMVLLLRRRSFEAYGLGVKRWEFNLSLGLVGSLLLVGIAAIGLLVTGFHFDSSRPPDPHAPHPLVRVARLAVVALPAFVLVLGLLWTRGRIVERIPPAVSIPALFALLAMPPLVAAHFHRPAMWLPTLWLFIGAGFGEEIFFRGYIQSRVDQAFGCPFRLPGFHFGAGLLVSSLLFGLIHALNTVDYFHGRFDFGWAYGLQNIATGLFYGCIRAKTGSVFPGAVIHGLTDAFARIPNLLP